MILHDGVQCDHCKTILRPDNPEDLAKLMSEWIIVHPKSESEPRHYCGTECSTRAYMDLVGPHAEEN